MEKVRIIIVERQTVFREALAEALSRTDGISIVDHYSRAEDVLTPHTAMEFDVMLCDVTLAGID
jgi:DNA-binding NarL/FixJ family response regulator